MGSSEQTTALTTETISKELDRIASKAMTSGRDAKIEDGTRSTLENVKQKLRYPWYILFILGNELCERFAFYGMKAVLTLYFLEAFFWTESNATLVYHVFIVISYFTPIFGAMLADGYIGKFMTIFSLSVVYVIGLVLMTLAAIPPIGIHPVAGFISGLMLVAVGTGGIKPCVNSYGGDQFKPGQERYREQFFSLFYVCINAGSLISTFVTPILRSDIPCLGKDGCYPAAFGLPAGLLIISLMLFLVGRPFYHDVPPTGNIVGKVVMCIWHAIRNKRKAKGSAKKKAHWLDYASDKYDMSFINDVKQIMPVLKMFLPLPVFWTLFDQKGSRWTLQANKMDGRITDSFYWKPDQVQIFNPVLILILVPVFETVVYPLLRKLGIEFRLLARMVVGMVVAGLAFVVAGVLQMEIDKTVPTPVPVGFAEIRAFNVMPCTINVTHQYRPEDFATLPQNGMYQLPDVAVSKTADLVLMVVPINCPGHFPQDFRVKVTEKGANSYFIFSENNIMNAKQIVEKKEKPRKGAGFVRFVFPFRLSTASGGGELVLINPDVSEGKKGFSYKLSVSRETAVFGEGSPIMDVAIDADQGKYEIYVSDPRSPSGLARHGVQRLEIPNGGVYTVILTSNAADQTPWIIHDVVAASSLNIFLQLPQYFLITIAEVLFSVTGVAFAYSQAPASMKAVLQAGWLLTTAVGNTIVIIISGAQFFEKQSDEFFMFAGLIGVFAILFGVMSRYYHYVETPGTGRKLTVEDTDEEAAKKR